MIVPDEHMIYLSELCVLLVDQFRHRPRMRSAMSMCGYSLMPLAVSVTKLLLKYTTSWRGSGQRQHRMIQLTCVYTNSRRVRSARCLKMVGIIADFMLNTSHLQYSFCCHCSIVPSYSYGKVRSGTGYPASVVDCQHTVLHLTIYNCTVSRSKISCSTSGTSGKSTLWLGWGNMVDKGLPTNVVWIKKCVWKKINLYRSHP